MAKKLDERKNNYFNALNRLEDALKKDLDDDIIIDGIIQRFEFTFEQAWKAAGFSSNTADYFAVEDAVLVEMKNS